MSLLVASASPVVATLLAAGMIWRLATEPVTLVAAVDQGSVTVVLRALADLLVDELMSLLRYP